MTAPVQAAIASASADPFTYQPGFGNDFTSEDPRCPGSLPQVLNTPQNCPYGLYAELLSGSSFTSPRSVGANRRTWLYRIRPSVLHGRFESYASNRTFVSDFGNPDLIAPPDPNQTRWMPFPMPSQSHEVDWVDGMHTLCGAGDPHTRFGLGIHIYTCNASMKKRVFWNSDGALMLVPQEGALTLRTEMGRMRVVPNEIACVPIGVKFAVDVEGPSRGYVLEVFDSTFVLPDLGPIGSSGLANPRDFLSPTAHYEDDDSSHVLLFKYQGELFKASADHSPLDVVAWHGNHVPFKYDLRRFMVINSVSFDHADPSIFTVLSARGAKRGTSLVDVAIFPPRWGVQEGTFRPPYYHRNCMSEMMGLISGKYEAKPTGFQPGGATLHSMMIPHGPDRECFEAATKAELRPERVAENSLAFMFESSLSMRATLWAVDGEGGESIDKAYHKCWDPLQKHFTGPNAKP